MASEVSSNAQAGQPQDRRPTNIKFYEQAAYFQVIPNLTPGVLWQELLSKLGYFRSL